MLLLSAGLLEGSSENVGIQNITYNADAEGKFFDVALKNYGNNIAAGRLEINFKCDKFNDTSVKNFEISPDKTMDFVYFYDFCECEVSAGLNVKNNVNKQTTLTKNFSAVEINFDELNLMCSGKIFPNLNTTFRILTDVPSAKEIYRGNVVDGKFSFELPETGKFVMEIENNSCSRAKKFETKYNTIIAFKDTKEGDIIEGKEFKILVTNQKAEPIGGVSVFCNEKSCGRTDGNGIFNFFANKSFLLSIPETASTWPAKREIVVKERPKINIVIKKDEKEQENFSVLDSAIITFEANNLSLENVSVRITNKNTNKTIVNTTSSGTEIFSLNEEGVYEISAEKDNFMPAKKEIFVKRNFDVSNISVDVENDKVTLIVVDAITKEGVSSAVVTIEYTNSTRTKKTDIDGEIIFKIPEEKYKFCVEKENYNKICREGESMRKLKIKLSKNYIFEDHYEVFSNLTLTTFYAYKDIQVIVDEIFVKTESRNFSIKPTYAQTNIFLNETGNYEIHSRKKGYNEEIINIFVEKTDIDVYLSVSKNLLFISPSKQVNEIKIKCNNTGNEDTSLIELWNVTSGKVEIKNISEKTCELVLPEQYRAKFYINNMFIPTNSTDSNTFKLTIKKVYDWTWMYTAIIIVVLLSLLVIVQHRYKKKK